MKTILHLFPGPAGTPVEGIRLEQHGVDNFTVRYGFQTKSKLGYAQAYRELGECIFHHLACEGLLDNRSKADERRERAEAKRQLAEELLSALRKG